MCLMQYVVNLILVMQLLFLVLAGGRCKLTENIFKTVVDHYKTSFIKSNIHRAIKEYGATGRGRDQTFETVSSLIKRHYNCEEIHELKQKILALNNANATTTSG